MKKHFIFATILNVDALYDKCAVKISSFYFHSMITLTSTSVTHNFLVHKMFCLSFSRTCYKSDPPCNICVKITCMVGVVSYFWQ